MFSSNRKFLEKKRPEIEKVNLEIHERVHNGEKPYPCRFCNEHFKALITAKNHEKIHINEKAYA